MRYKFKGLKKWDAEPHYLKYLVRDEVYYVGEDEDDTKAIFTIDERGIKIYLSNNQLREYFIKM